jgi:hypothetical protein
MWAAGCGRWHWHERFEKPDGTWFMARISICGIGKRTTEELARQRVFWLEHPEAPMIGGACTKCSNWLFLHMREHFHEATSG